MPLCERVPAPVPEQTDELRAMMFDAEYNDYRGVISYFKMVSG